jgi:hypothetical protein
VSAIGCLKNLLLWFGFGGLDGRALPLRVTIGAFFSSESTLNKGCPECRSWVAVGGGRGDGVWVVSALLCRHLCVVEDVQEGE